MKRSLASVVGKSNRLKLDKMEVVLPLPERLMGIEIEVERVPEAIIVTRPCPAGWAVVSDGSLRDGVEYKLSAPLAGASLAGAIESMFQNNKFFRRHTSSCHIHVDILEEEVTEETLQSLFLLAFMTEEVLYQVGDSGRKWCGFTNTLTSLADSQVAALTLGQEEYNKRYAVYSHNRRDYDYFTDHLQSGSRYIGLNVQAMYKYGSIEFRYFPTPESKDELYNWVRIVQSYMKAAQSLDGLEAVKAMMGTEESYKSFIEEFFSEWKHMFFNHADYNSSKTKLTYALTLADSTFVLAPADVQPTYNVHKRFKRSKSDDAQEVEREAWAGSTAEVSPTSERLMPDRNSEHYLGQINGRTYEYLRTASETMLRQYRASLTFNDDEAGLSRFINDVLSMNDDSTVADRPASSDFIRRSRVLACAAEPTISPRPNSYSGISQNLPRDWVDASRYWREQAYIPSPQQGQ